MTRKATKSIKEIIESPVKEINSETTIEKLSPVYFDINSFARQPEPLYRLDASGHRYYYRFQDNEPVFYTSVTTMIKNTLPTSPHLIKWLVDQKGEGKDIAQEKAHYGTLLHMQCGVLLMTGKYDLDSLPRVVQDFTTKEKIGDKSEWLEDLKKDILAFAQFMIDRNVKPLAIEICLFHPTDGYAGALDLVCELTFNKKRVTAIIDIKSGRKGFYESHEIQLGAYREMWRVHFPDKPVDMLMNFSPKAWKKSPTYNLQDQTDSKNIGKLPHLVELSKLETAKRDDTITIISGKIDLTKGLESNISEKTFVELVKENK